LTREAANKYYFKNQGVKNILEILMRVFALKQLQEDNQGLYECGFFTKGCGKLIDEALKDVLVQLRPQMVPLVEVIDDSTYN
jgi:hypothetical protein